MRILVVHQHRRSVFPSGEDAVFREEVALLSRHGHQVETFVRHSDDLVGLRAKAGAALGAAYNPIAARDFRQHARRFSPDVVHFHNITPSISPAAVAAARQLSQQATPEHACALVMTLHSFWLLCAVGTFIRNGQPCEECLGRKVPWPSLRYGCYRHSRLTTLPLFVTQTSQRALGTIRHAVHRFIAPTRIVRSKYIEGGLPPERIIIKPHFVPDVGVASSANGGREAARKGCIFVGRLGEEKGVRQLFDAWQQLPDIPLRVVGDGPLRDWCRRHPAALSGQIKMVGQQTPQRCRALMAEARLLVFPSICYETFGLSIAEAFCAGTPVLATRGGAAEDHIEHGKNGWLCAPRDAQALATAVTQVWRDPRALAVAGRAARTTYEERFGEEQGHQKLLQVYQQALQVARNR